MPDQDREKQQLPGVDIPKIEEPTQQQSPSPPPSENPEWWRSDGGSGKTT